MPLKVSGNGPAPAGCSARHGGCAWIQHFVPGALPKKGARENLDEARISDLFSVFFSVFCLGFPGGLANQTSHPFGNR